MKLKELNDAVASSCNVRGNVVSAVQAETFRQIRVQLEKGEKVVVPDFGMFILKETPAEGDTPAKKVVRFREKSADKKSKKGKTKGGVDAPADAAGKDYDE